MVKVIEARALLTADDQASSKIVAMAKNVERISKAQQNYAKAGGSQFAALTKQIEATQSKLSAMSGYRKLTRDLDAASLAHRRAVQEANRMKAALDAAGGSNGKFLRDYERAAKAADNAKSIFMAQGRATRTAKADLEAMGVSVKRLAQMEQDLTRHAASATAQLQRQHLSAERWARRREAIGGIATGAALAAGYGVKRGVSATLHTYREFDNERRFGKAVMGLSDDEQRPLVNQALHMGATTKFNDIQVLHGQRDLAARGVSPTAILGMMPAAADLGMAAGQTLPEAVKLMEAGIFMFKKQTDSIETASTSARQTADAMVKAMKISGMTPEDVGQIYKYGAPGARMSGVSEQSLLGFGGLLKKAGIGGDESGVAFRALMGTIQSPTRGARTALLANGLDYSNYQRAPDRLAMAPFVKDIAAQYGVRLDKDAQGDLEKVFSNRGLISDAAKFAPAVMDVLSAHLGGDDAKSKKSIAGAANRYRNASMQGVDANRFINDLLTKMQGNLQFANALFGQKQGSRIATALGDAETFEKLRKMLSGDADGYASNIAKERMAGFDGAVSRFEGAVMNLKSRLGQVWDNEGKGGPLTALADAAAKATQGLAEMPTATLQVVSAFGTAAASLAALAAGGKVAGALGLPGGAAVGAMAGGAFARLPSMALRSAPWAMLGYGYYDLLSKGYEPATADRENAKPGEAHDWGRKRRQRYNQMLREDTFNVRQSAFPTFAAGGFNLGDMSRLQNLKAVVSDPVDVTGKVKLDGKAQVGVTIRVDGPGQVTGMSMTSSGDVYVEGAAMQGTPGIPSPGQPNRRHW